MSATGDYVLFPDEYGNNDVVMCRHSILSISPDFKDAEYSYVYFKGREKPLRINCTVQTAWKVMREGGEE